MAASVLVEPCTNTTERRFEDAPVASLRLAWALLAFYAVIFLLAAAFIFRRQEAQT
jgi:hypothetical protein